MNVPNGSLTLGDAFPAFLESQRRRDALFMRIVEHEVRRLQRKSSQLDVMLITFARTAALRARIEGLWGHSRNGRAKKITVHQPGVDSTVQTVPEQAAGYREFPSR
jgi:hypothetical protein